LVIAIAALACMALAVQQRARFPLISSVVASVTAPFNRGLLAVNTELQDWRQDNRSRESLAEENAELKRMLANLQSAEFRIAGLQAENDLLRRMVGYREAHPLEQLLAARVLGTDAGGLHDCYLLDKGAQDGVKENMCVVTHAGLVGVIDEVYPTTSRLLLLSSARMRIGARVVRSASRAVGVLTGIGVAGARLRMEYLPREADIAAGDLIVTSGVGGRYLPNIFVGTVAKVELDAAGLLKRALVQEAATSISLEMVYIITDVTGAEELPAALTTADTVVSEKLTREKAEEQASSGSSYTKENAPKTAEQEAQLEAERRAQEERARADDRSGQTFMQRRAPIPDQPLPAPQTEAEIKPQLADEGANAPAAETQQGAASRQNLPESNRETGTAPQQAAETRKAETQTQKNAEQPVLRQEGAAP